MTADPYDLGSYVQLLQQAVQKYSPPHPELARAVDEANQSVVSGSRTQVTVAVQTEGHAEPNTIRTTCPSETNVVIEADEKMKASRVRVFLTRPAAAGGASTRHVGTAAYPDADGAWRVSFQSPRFTRKVEDAVVLHTELLDKSGRVVAARAIPLRP